MNRRQLEIFFAQTALLTLAALFTPSAMLPPSGLAAEPSGDEIEFNRDIRPLLAANCFACHGADEEARKGELRLDTEEGSQADLGGYRAVAPGQPDQSRLIQRIESGDPELVMPPPKSGRQLTGQQRRLLREWIAGGANYDRHWSFIPPRKTPPPAVSQRDWAIQPWDAFILAALEAKGLQPAPEADRYELIRRVSLDLTGLPPTPEQADAFAADRREDAYERVVDRLLNSDAFGERWARMWLDLARYADTKGYEKDRHRDIWRYRDWVIDALNRDLPFDQFTIEQLAGDLLPNPTADQLLATAFHRNTLTNEEGGTDNEEFRVAAVKDRVDTTVQVWMGLTMGCAKCHSHKYDPLSIEDYYSFYAFFNQTEDADRGDDSPLAATPTKDQTDRLAALRATDHALQQRLREAAPGRDAAYSAWRMQDDATQVWRPLTLSGFASQHNVELEQRDDGLLIASGDRPEKDVWTLTLEWSGAKPIRALRLEVMPRAASGGEWDDHNFVLSELAVDVVEAGREPRRLKLTQPRADFSQQDWDVAKSIDGNSKTGWAVAPKIAAPHAAVFDVTPPLQPSPAAQLRVTLAQQHGQQHVLARIRVLASSLTPNLLTADLDVEAGLRAAFERNEFPPTRELHQQLAACRKSIRELSAAVVATPVMRELPPGKQRETRIHERGNFLSPGANVAPRAPSQFADFFPDASPSRLGVARWIVHAENPLTARVMVNRVWARLFGVGIVETEEDFGSQGAAPQHPEVLDWLAVDFRENGWSLKRLLRSLALSAAYRQSSAATPQKLELDPGNRLCSRGPRFRLPAETVRDQALAASGLLSVAIGGPSVMPPQPPGVWKSTYNALQWENADGADRYRRGLYTYWKRTSPYPAMTTFDAGSGEVCQIRRVRTNTPLQALVTLNDPAFLEAAGALAARMDAVEGPLRDKIQRGFRLLLTRPPSQREIARLAALYDALQTEYASDPEAAAALLRSARAAGGDAPLVAVANVLLNLDEALMKP